MDCGCALLQDALDVSLPGMLHVHRLVVGDIFWLTSFAVWASGPPNGDQFLAPKLGPNNTRANCHWTFLPVQFCDQKAAPFFGTTLLFWGELGVGVGVWEWVCVGVGVMVWVCPCGCEAVWVWV